MEWLREFLRQEWVKAALGVLIGYGVTFLPVPPQVQAAIAAVIIGLIGAWSALNATRAYRAKRLRK